MRERKHLSIKSYKIKINITVNYQVKLIQKHICLPDAALMSRPDPITMSQIQLSNKISNFISRSDNDLTVRQLNVSVAFRPDSKHC